MRAQRADWQGADWLARCVWLLAVAFSSVAVRAEGELDGEFAVVSATSMFKAGVVELSAAVRFPQSERIRDALQEGVTLAFDLEVNISRERRFWFDADVVSFNMRRVLAYHIISDRYVLRDANAVELGSFPTLAAALAQLGKIDQLPIAVDPQLRGEGPWLVSLRAGVRRGRVPDALRALVFWSDAWHRTSEWQTWNLAR
jgi:Domain of unknown function (DUF4390)